jgi:hypothetical protein
MKKRKEKVVSAVSGSGVPSTTTTTTTTTNFVDTAIIS